MARLFKSNMHVFWQALIVAVVIFNLGIFLGYMLESSRVGKVNELYAKSELALLDVKIQSDLFELESLDCSSAIEKNIEFADKVYEEGKILQRFEDSSRITESIKLQHKKYDLLRTLFWLNSIKIRDKCNASYHTVVYFYRYNEPDLELEAKQNVFSNMLGELKEKYGNEVMLIPIAADNEISSVDILIDLYNITELPTVLIDERMKVTEIESVEELEKYLS